MKAQNIGKAEVARSVLLLATGWTIGVRFLAVAGDFSLPHRVQIGSGTHSDSYPMGTGGSFPGGKAVGA
jgi:hypothetical protein